MNVFDMESYLGKSRFNGMLYDIAWRKSSSALSLFVDKAKIKKCLYLSCWKMGVLG